MKKHWKGHAWRRRKYQVSVYKLNMQILSQTPFTKKGSYNSTSLQGKTTMSNLNLEEKMRWSLRQAWPFLRNYVLREVRDVHRRTGEHLCL